jgi:hypothetical protein
MTSASILVPFDVTASMLKTGTNIPEVDTGSGEVAFNAAGTYGTGDEVADGGWIWSALKPLSSTVPTPGTDATAWLKKTPTNRMAPFDDRLDTKAVKATSLTYVIQPGIVTGMAMYGLFGDHLNVKIYDGASKEYEYDADLFEQAMGLYELLFMPLKPQTQFFLPDIDLYPDPKFEIEITGDICEVALITFGQWDTIIGVGEFGGVEYGAQAEVRSYSYAKRNDDGSVTRLRRGSANNVNCSVIIEASEANHALSMLHASQGRPVAFIAVDLAQYEYLNGFGDISGTVESQSPVTARVELKIEGAVQGASL